MSHQQTCQQYNLYAAEREVPRGRIFSTEEELQFYVDSLRESDWWERNFPQVRKIDAFFKASGDHSCGAMYDDHFGQIEMLPEHRCELIVLHEVCHPLAKARYNSQSHDPWFARTYLEAVWTFMGVKAYSALDGAFRQFGIDCDTDNSNPAARFVL